MSSLIPIEINLFGGNGDTDTFITNATGSKPAYDPIGNGFVTLPDSEDGELLLRHREYLKCGFSGDAEYRTVVLFQPLSRILKETGDRPYGIDRAFLTLTLADGATGGDYEAVLLPLSSPTDGSVSWYKPTEAAQTAWTVAGGDVQPPLSGETPSARLTDSKLVFDLSDYITQWSISGAETLAVAVKSTLPTTETVKFHSWESQEGLLGDGILQNCRFLAAGDTNSMRTEGVFVQIEANEGTSLLTLADGSEKGQQQFAAFQHSVGVGATFTLLDPDENNSITFGDSVCTVLDRPTENSVLLSGLVFPSGVTAHSTTVEFAAETTIPYGSYVLQLENPSATLKAEALALTEDQKLSVRYFTTAANSNSKDFTVSAVTDETRYKSRVRIFLNEGTISENRNGLDTQVVLSETKPALTLHISAY
jgi:hypothetical protein